jgi:ElaA protein
MNATPSNITLSGKPFAELTVLEVYDVLRLRQAVFVVEQQCPYQDADGLDPISLHLLARHSSGQLAGCLRIVPPGARFPEPSIGRVVVEQTMRRHGIGTAVMTRGIEMANDSYPTLGIRISAQTYLEDFYRSFGFASVGIEYLEDGIPHVEMLRRASA